MGWDFEQLALMVGLVLMIVVPIGILLYVALVIAIPVCRMLDWFTDQPGEWSATRRTAPPTGIMARLARIARQMLSHGRRHH